MEKALCYKEWIKTRYYYFLAILVSWGMTGYCILKINRAITMKGASMGGNARERRSFYRLVDLFTIVDRDIFGMGTICS